MLINKFKLVSLFFLVCTVSFLSGQRDELKNYNFLKYKAESMVIAGEYCNASDSYLNMIDSFHLWLPDMNNALLSGLLCQNYDFVDIVASKFLKGGYDPTNLERNYSTFEYFNSEKWDQIKRTNFEFQYNSKIRSTIEVMYIRDQKNRSLEYERMRNDMENMIDLLKIIEEYGFPTEKEIGYTEKKDSLDYNQMFQIVLIHLCRLFPQHMSEMLKEQYFARRITATRYISLIGYTKPCDDNQLTCFIGPPATNALFVDDVIFSCSDQDMKRINFNRNVHFLDSVEEQIGKVEFRKSSKLTWYLDNGFATWNYNKEKYTFESFKAKLEKDGLKVFKISN